MIGRTPYGVKPNRRRRRTRGTPTARKGHRAPGEMKSTAPTELEVPPGPSRSTLFTRTGIEPAEGVGGRSRSLSVSVGEPARRHQQAKKEGTVVVILARIRTIGPGVLAVVHRKPHTRQTSAVLGCPTGTVGSRNRTGSAVRHGASVRTHGTRAGRSRTDRIARHVPARWDEQLDQQRSIALCRLSLVCTATRPACKRVAPCSGLVAPRPGSTPIVRVRHAYRLAAEEFTLLRSAPAGGRTASVFASDRASRLRGDFSLPHPGARRFRVSSGDRDRAVRARGVPCSIVAGRSTSVPVRLPARVCRQRLARQRRTRFLNDACLGGPGSGRLGVRPASRGGLISF